MKSFPAKAIPVLLALGVLIYLFIWPGRQNSSAPHPATDKLIADLDDHARQVEQQAAELPKLQAKTPAHELIEHATKTAVQLRVAISTSEELTRRAEEVFDQAPAPRRPEITQALKDYTARMAASYAKFKELTAQLKDRTGIKKE